MQKRLSTLPLLNDDMSLEGVLKLDKYQLQSVIAGLSQTEDWTEEKEKIS